MSRFESTEKLIDWTETIPEWTVAQRIIAEALITGRMNQKRVRRLKGKNPFAALGKRESQSVLFFLPVAISNPTLTPGTSVSSIPQAITSGKEQASTAILPPEDMYAREYWRAPSMSDVHRPL